MATVYLATAAERAPGDRKLFAVKRLHAHYASDPQFCTMFLDEAMLTSRITHRNVARTFEVVRDRGELFLVMEYVEGDSLHRLLKTFAPPPFDVIARVVVDTLIGLHAAHTATDENGALLGVVHRDVSPHNIIVGADGLARVIDFGVAKAAGRMTHTVDGQVKGKLAYMAPEQLQGAVVSARADVFSVGVVLWEFLTGRRLFAAENEGAVVNRVLHEPIRRPKEVWAETAEHTLSLLGSRELGALDEVTMRALVRDPGARYASAQQMAIDLERAIECAPPEDVAQWVKAAARKLLAERAAAAKAILDASESSAPRLSARSDRRPNHTAPTLADHAAAIRPIIVADLRSAKARDLLVEAARHRNGVIVPLLNAPIDGGEHLLEVHVPGEQEPTLLLASPLGPPTDEGFPLRLRLGAETSDVRARRGELPTQQVEGRRTIRHALTVGHTRDLSAEAAHAVMEVSLLGRVLGGGKLRIDERVGGGGAGAVYRALHLGLQKQVAVKILRERPHRDLRFCERFHAEALAASRLDHESLARVLDFGQESDGLLYVSMEFLDGTTLRDFLDRYGRLGSERALKIMVQIATGLAHAHARGVVHGDVKPSNVMLVLGRDDEGNPAEIAKVCDFGIALQSGSVGASEHAGIAATSIYMSPEQRRGDALDGCTDVYSCGVVLFELLVGRPPIEAESHVPGAPRAVENIVKTALADDRNARFASMRDFRAAVREALSGDGAPRVSHVPPAPSNKQADASRPSVTAVAEAWSRAPAEQQAQLARLKSEPKKLELALSEIGGIGVSLANRSDFDALVAIVRAVTRIYDDAPRELSPRDAPAVAAAALQAIHSLASPATLVPIAKSVLASDAPGAALSLLSWAKVAGVLALFNARLSGRDAGPRARFVAAMEKLARSAGPVLRNALHDLLPDDEQPPDEALAADLLTSVPHVHDDELGTVLARYVRIAHPRLSPVALSALVHAWGERAHPLLLASMQADDAELRAAALRGLAGLGAVDALVVSKIEGILATPALSPTVAAACRDALASANVSRT
jgi:serine/threonine-protein kinase